MRCDGVDFIEKYEKWLNYSHLPEELREELESIVGKTDEIEERFFKDLEFGTGGLRGIIGAGTNRMNIYTVRKATLGLANYLKKVSQDNSVVIAYDSRYKSREFALEAALVLAKNKIKAYVFQKITPTPVLSFAIRYLEATAGIVITASHNPKEYNGYKVYNCHGGQITDKMALAITEEINQVEDELKVNVLAQKEAEEKDLLVWLDEEVLSAYLAKTKGLVLRPDIIEENSFDLQIVYTPLHGTGYIPVSRLFKETGFKNVHIVEEQAKPDPDFSTVKYPNPEEHVAFRLALNLAEKVQADIVLATDPDADRLGVAVRDEKGKYVILTGNQLGALMIDYILQMRKYKGNLPINGVVVKTIVTSSLGVEIAKSYGVGYLEVLTGFKYIGEKIKEFYEDRNHTFIFGYEESYGFLIGDFVRDKDAVQSCLVAAEMAAYYKKRNMSLWDRLQQLYVQYGYYKEDLVSFTLKGIEGQKRIGRILNALRANKPEAIFNYKKIIVVKDYWLKQETDLITGEIKPTNLPQANVLHYTLEDGSWFCIRPSGTEPKLKIYFSVVGDTEAQAQERLAKLRKSVLAVIEEIE